MAPTEVGALGEGTVAAGAALEGRGNGHDAADGDPTGPRADVETPVGCALVGEEPQAASVRPAISAHAAFMARRLVEAVLQADHLQAQTPRSEHLHRYREDRPK